MSHELFKGMSYKRNKVYTRQCSNNIFPKDFTSEENPYLTDKYRELGKVDFEKWFIFNCMIEGAVMVYGNDSKVLNRINTVYNNLWNNREFKDLMDIHYRCFLLNLNTNNTSEKEKINNEDKEIIKKIENLVSKSYDKIILKKQKDEKTDR